MARRDETETTTLPRPQRLALLALGYLCLALAVIGAVLPVMPTTIFLLIAAWAFGRASPTLQAKLLNHPRFGPGLRAWRAHGAISLRAKRAALSVMAVSWIVMTLALRSWLASGIAGACMLAVGIYIGTRPSGPS
ncbi:YbaN family protein [Siccirubricoccus sp. KC 17139]|uniref:YbaN family protein n=1 Tax=Siccirubricoccus soli TaxID=2899147 RepID=A0ABT1D4N9_9PROT|nr:YbaN family protein [Siccirubricoccus soli]MCO6416881.1 YbaN family protein [Siccirubricoccus soli]MCP2683016.1 YbaN family protein [Siccirubricoccus soli]